jgi:membrane protease YdiL (CAAX protease family)
MTTTAQKKPATRFFRHPLVWMVAGVVPIVALSSLLESGPLVALLATALSLVAYWAVMRFVAKRPMPELARRHALRDSLTGVAIGAGFIVVSIGIITALGGYHFTFDGAAGLRALPGLVVLALGGAITEELIFRGLALQAIEKLAGSWVALGVTALLFGLAHAANPGAGLWSSVAIAIEAGGLMGAAFLWRRSLWLVFALHATWNGLEQAFGIPVSGHVDPGLAVATVHGSAALTGGEFGLEASLVPVLISLALTAILMWAAHRNGQIRRPARSRRI